MTTTRAYFVRPSNKTGGYDVYDIAADLIFAENLELAEAYEYAKFLNVNGSK